MVTKVYGNETSRWPVPRSAGSSVGTPERTGKPVGLRTACTGCAEVCAASGGRQGADLLTFCSLDNTMAAVG